MQLGMIGLGRMGANLVRGLAKDGHQCVVYGVSGVAVKAIEGDGIQGCGSLDELIEKIDKPRAVWVMVPAGVTGETVEVLASRMHAGDIIVDGGNSYCRDGLPRAKALEAKSIHYVDCGTSGGVFGSWLLDLTAASLLENPDLKSFAGRVPDSGEGRWTIAAAIDETVPAPVLSTAPYERFASRDGADFANQVLSAMGKQFDGHDEKSKVKKPR